MRYDHNLTKLNYTPSIYIHHYILHHHHHIYKYINHIISIIYFKHVYHHHSICLFIYYLSLYLFLAYTTHTYTPFLSLHLLGQHLRDSFLLLEVEPVREWALVCAYEHVLLREVMMMKMMTMMMMMISLLGMND